MLNVFPLILFACLGGGFLARLSASEPSLLPADGPPSQIIESVPTTASVPPAQAVAPTLPRQRVVTETDLLALLTTALQKECVKDKGDLELRLARPWTPAAVPDEPLSVKILDLPTTGVASSFILRFELRTARAAVGTWQLSLQARIWRDVWIARSALKKGEPAADADLERDRRDVLTLREPLADFSPDDTSLELAEPLQAGSPLFARSVKARPVIHRGQAADALVQDGTMSITMKVEALEDGAPGQIIRVRNAQSRRDIRGKVLNEQTILIPL
jgi:flagella basal body P-ring formation protein FlgA